MRDLQCGLVRREDRTEEGACSCCKRKERKGRRQIKVAKRQKKKERNQKRRSDGHIQKAHDTSTTHVGTLINIASFLCVLYI